MYCSKTWLKVLFFEVGTYFFLVSDVLFVVQEPVDKLLKTSISTSPFSIANFGKSYFGKLKKALSVLMLCAPSNRRWSENGGL